MSETENTKAKINQRIAKLYDQLDRITIEEGGNSPAIDTSQGLRLLAELERSGAITETSLTLPPDLPFDQYEALATMFGQLHRTSAWIIGDLLNYGEKVYGETYAQASAATGLAEQTLMNYASVCGRVPRSRRRKKLPFSIHAEVAYLPPTDQETWLRKAANEGWTRGRIRDELAPMRAALAPVATISALPPGDRNGDGPDSRILESKVEILPPSVDGHICQCNLCGRYHRSDEDVEA